MNRQKVLVTGASGFLGKHLVNDLVRKDYQVTVLARKSSDLSSFQNKGINVIFGDITERLTLLQACVDKNIVFHLAGLIAYKRSDRPAMEEINVKGTANVIDACITNKVGRFLHLSSVVTIGATTSPKALNEDFHYNLEKYDLGYFETKRKAEKMVMDAYHNDGLQAYMINPSTIYGAGDATKGSRKTQIKVAQGKFKFYPPGGVSVVAVEDVVRAIHLCLEKGQPARRYIVSGENLTLKELFTIIAEVAGVAAPNIPLPRFLLKTLGCAGDVMRSMGKETSLSSETAVTASLYHWYTSERAQKELGFKSTPARKAIEESVSWMIKNGLLN